MSDQADRPRCRGTKKDGGPCRCGFGLSADFLCLHHDPQRADLVAATLAARGRRAKGKAIETPLDVPPIAITLDDAAYRFAWISHAVLIGKIDARTGHEASYALAGFRAATEKKEWQRRLEELEQRFARQQAKDSTP